MTTVWVVVGCVVGGVAALLIWMLLVSIVVVHLEDRQRHRHAGR